MRTLVELSASRSARLLVMEATATRVLRSIKHNIDDSDHARYVAHFVNTCPWRPELAEKPAGRLYSTSLDFRCSQKAYLETEFFNDWARPQDIHHGLCGTLFEAEGLRIQFLIQRTRAAGSYTAAERDWMNRHLVPHLRRNCLTALQLAAVEDRGQAIGLAAGHARLPFLLLDASGRLCHATPEAERMLHEDFALALANGRPRLAHAAEDRRLQQLIERARQSASGSWNDAGGLMQVQRMQAPPLQLMVWPVPEGSQQALFASLGGFVCIYLHDPLAEVELNIELLMQAHGLSSAEARVALGIARGQSLEALAASLHRSIHTLRSQLKSVFAKTGTRRQNELTHLILSGPAATRTGEGKHRPD